jgi:glycosyltransferase involved in cell wall biosynthesis
MTRPRVLVVAYFFPPLGGAGVQRTLKFAKYLPQHGWDPVVITTDSDAYPVADASLAREIPAGLPVTRAHELSLFRTLARVAVHVPLPHSSLPFAWPDDAVGWFPGAVRVAMAAVRRLAPDVIYTTSSPYTSHLVGLAVARRSGLPWVLDFRDEWSLNPYAAGLPRPVAWANRYAERAALRQATSVVRAADYFRFADERWNAAAVTLPNGVDEEDFADQRPASRTGRFRISYVGTLYGKRDAAPVLAAISALVQRGEIASEHLEMRAVGNVWNELTVPPGVHMTTTGYLPHAEAIREMGLADVLLLYEPPGSLATTGKVFEYLASGRPVLCVAPAANRAARLVRELGAGLVAEPEDASGIERAVATLYRRWLEEGLPLQTEVRAATLERYSRRRLAGRLAQVLDDAADSGGRLPRDGDEVRTQEGQQFKA